MLLMDAHWYVLIEFIQFFELSSYFKGEMEITPACYAHLISPLMALAEGRIAAFLEGGYHLESLAESAAITLRTFLGDPCPLLEMLDEPSDR